MLVWAKRRTEQENLCNHVPRELVGTFIMKNRIHLKRVVGIVAALALSGGASGAEESLVTAVFARMHNGYVRAQEADGSPKRETYVVGKGEYRAGLHRNSSIDEVPFAGVVRALAPYLAQQNYVPAPDKQTADLILVLHWGTTKPWQDGDYRNMMTFAFDGVRNVQNLQSTFDTLDRGVRPVSPGDKEAFDAVIAAARNDMTNDLMMLELAERARSRANEGTANLLGYTEEINRRNNITLHAGLQTAFDDLIQDIEEARYYVVIGAYDFQEVLKGRHKLLWETRVSIREQGNRFDQWLPTMFANASDYFGRESKRLVRQYQRATKVELGELKTLGIVGEGDEEMDK